MKLRFLTVAALALASAAFGQNVFVVLEDGAPKLVKEIRNRTPMIDKAGKLAGAGGNEYGFAPSTVFRPGLVTLADFRVQVTHIETMEGDRFNYDLHINGRAKSDTAFQKCFMVLEMTAWKAHGVAFAEMPNLPAGESVDLNLNFQLAERLEEGTYRVHLFSDGIELLHTKLPDAYVTEQKQKTAALLSGKIQDWRPILAYSPKPIYPESLKASPISGSVKVRLHVTKTGDVASPEVVSATDPAFGDAALAAVAKWKFDPAMKGRKFVDATIEIPIQFRPPKPK